ncbi:polysaccharide deacetylase family protein [Lysobacter gummosus]|uniref:Polysaccharide deacetylase family protein n=1 Tax=Lysobacter gummosus TaxID=262324 RepID=A0ABY3XEY4_9GAMM|nr:polysaccharide deacetylase family protein [Lysobacter gummosus]ALN89559.1 polysaccharide deacetylase family protein [Lysobacter gummosus]UNP30196.1 polysaccharide deacetylase family protein [Lysobacter gummosus]
MSIASIAAPHRPPRRPWAWLWLFGASQLLMLALWWRFGWAAGLLAMLVSHGAMFWGTLWPRSRLFGPVLARLPTQARAMWLTIDDGPSDDTPAMLDLLDAYGAKATFFLVAERAAARPQLAREIVRRGHGIGNHSQSHPQAWFWALGPGRMAAEIEQAQAGLRAVTGVTPRWFRAVVGMANPFVSASLKKLALARVAWSARGFDGVRGEPDSVVARIVADFRPGAIVLLHEGAPHGNNVAIVEGVLRAMKDAGYVAVVPE